MHRGASGLLTSYFSISDGVQFTGSTNPGHSRTAGVYHADIIVSDSKRKALLIGLSGEKDGMGQASIKAVWMPGPHPCINHIPGSQSPSTQL